MSLYTSSMCAPVLYSLSDAENDIEKLKAQVSELNSDISELKNMVLHLLYAPPPEPNSSELEDNKNNVNTRGGPMYEAARSQFEIHRK